VTWNQELELGNPLYWTLITELKAFAITRRRNSLDKEPQFLQARLNQNACNESHFANWTQSSAA
jgi:hypothetical protein